MPRQMFAPQWFSRGGFFSVVIPSALRLKKFTGRRRRGQFKDKDPSRYSVFSAVNPAEELHGCITLEQMRWKRRAFSKQLTRHIDHFQQDKKVPTLSRVMTAVLKDLRADVNSTQEVRRTEGTRNEFIKFLVERKRDDARKRAMNAN